MEKQKRLVVLVVEDEPLMLMDALDLVTDAGFEAIGAKNADEAIRILENRNDIRVVFTDVNMPGSMDGIKLAHAVRNRWPPIEIIVTSGLNLANVQELRSAVSFSQSLTRQRRLRARCIDWLHEIWLWRLAS